MKKKGRIVLIVVLAAVLVGGGVFVGIHWSGWFGEDAETAAELDSNAEDYTGDRDTYTGQKNTDTIDIPGFDSMTFQADETEQSVNLYNPEQNSCYFKMSIYLEDGTKLWESALVEPGKAIYTLTMEQALSAGTYENCTLKYECFAMDEGQTPLNGSEIRFTLNVLE